MACTAARAVQSPVGVVTKWLGVGQLEGSGKSSPLPPCPALHLCRLCLPRAPQNGCPTIRHFVTQAEAVAWRVEEVRRPPPSGPDGANSSPRPHPALAVATLGLAPGCGLARLSQESWPLLSLPGPGATLGQGLPSRHHSEIAVEADVGSAQPSAGAVGGGSIPDLLTDWPAGRAQPQTQGFTVSSWVAPALI